MSSILFYFSIIWNSQKNVLEFGKTQTYQEFADRPYILNTYTLKHESKHAHHDKGGSIAKVSNGIVFSSLRTFYHVDMFSFVHVTFAICWKRKRSTRIVVEPQLSKSCFYLISKHEQL